MNNSELRRIRITGKDIVGINLREKIKEIADGRTGFVRNRRDKSPPQVEIICKAGDAEQIKKGIEDLKNKQKYFIKIDSVDLLEDFFDDGDFSPGQFKVIREDDLQEMVWALRGAGKVFSDLEKGKTIGLVEGLKAELDRMSDWLSTLPTSRTEFQPICLRNFIMQHPVPFETDKTKRLFEMLTGFDEFCNMVSMSLKAKSPSKIDEREIENVLRRIDLAKTQLDHLKEGI